MGNPFKLAVKDIWSGQRNEGLLYGQELPRKLFKFHISLVSSIVKTLLICIKRSGFRVLISGVIQGVVVRPFWLALLWDFAQKHPWKTRSYCVCFPSLHSSLSCWEGASEAQGCPPPVHVRQRWKADTQPTTSYLPKVSEDGATPPGALFDGQLWVVCDKAREILSCFFCSAIVF